MMQLNETMEQSRMSCEEAVQRGITALEDLMIRGQVRRLIEERFELYNTMSNEELDVELTESIEEFEAAGLKLFAILAKDAREEMRITKVRYLDDLKRCFESNFEEFYISIKRNFIK